MKVLEIIKRSQLKTAKGSALLTVLLFAAIFTYLILGLVQNTTQATTYTHRTFTFLEGLEEVNRALTLTAYSAVQGAEDPQGNYSYPHYLFWGAPPSFFSFLDKPASVYDGDGPKAVGWHPSVEVKVGDFTGPYRVIRKVSGQHVSDGVDPNKDQGFMVRELTLFAKSEAFHRQAANVKNKFGEAKTEPAYDAYFNTTPAALGPTSYGKCVVEIREIPLIAYRFFSNYAFSLEKNDLELMPAATPVSSTSGFLHSNSNIQLVTGGGLTIRNPITAGGRLLADGTADLKVRHLEEMPPGQIEPEIMQSNNYGSEILDSNSPAWRDRSLELWRGNYLTDVHGVSRLLVRNVRLEFDDTEDKAYQNPSGFKSNSNNPGWALVEPALPDSSHPDYKSPDEFAKMNLHAGLVFKLKTTGVGNTRRLKNSQGAYTNYYLDISAYDAHLNDDPYAPGLNRVALTITPSVFDKIFRMHAYTTDGAPDSFYDRARTLEVNLLAIDVGELNALFGTTNPLAPFDTTLHYNGVMYVSMPEGVSEASSSGREDKIRPPADGFGVLLTNATNVPIPSFLKHPAFILATNNVIYLKGGLNHAGKLCALLADNVVVLSKDFKFETSKSLSKPTAAASILAPVGSTEAGINAAFFIAGRRPLPYLENWSGKTIAFKGSVASVFKKELPDVVEKPEECTLPTLVFEHNSKFVSGETLYHPLLPVARSYRIKEKRSASLAEYNK